MEKVLVIGLVDEYEGDAPLYFDLNDKETPQLLVSYIKNNIEHNENKSFFVKEMTQREFNELEK